MKKNKAEIMEKYVADAISEKPLSFSITRDVVTETEKKEVESVPLKLFPFIKRKVERVVKVSEVLPEVLTFEIHPPVLGKIQMLSKLYLDLDISDKDLKDNPFSTMMEICSTKTRICAKMMAIATMSTKEEILDDSLVSERAELFEWACEPPDFAKVILAIIAQSHYANFLNSIALTRIWRQNEPMQKKETDAIE